VAESVGSGVAESGLEVVHEDDKIRRIGGNVGGEGHREQWVEVRLEKSQKAHPARHVGRGGQESSHVRSRRTQRIGDRQCPNVCCAPLPDVTNGPEVPGRRESQKARRRAGRRQRRYTQGEESEEYQDSQGSAFPNNNRPVVVAPAAPGPVRGGTSRRPLGDGQLPPNARVPQENSRNAHFDVLHSSRGVRTNAQKGIHHRGNAPGHPARRRADASVVSRGSAQGRGRPASASISLARGFVSYDASDILNYVGASYAQGETVHDCGGILDPVDPGLVGRVCIPGGPLSSPIGLASALLTDPSTAAKLRCPDRRCSYLSSHSRFRTHISELLASGLAKKKVRSHSERGYARFFTVVKKLGRDGKPILRTILDCQEANAVFEDPPPVNLCPLRELLKVFESVEDLRTLDLRHWYHQIPVGEHLQQFFTLGFGALRIQWTVLPMGWKWACFVAQSLTWFAVAGQEAYEWSDLPRVWHQGGVRVAVVYDNVIAGGPTAELEVFWRGLRERLSAINAVVKEDFCHSDGHRIETLGICWRPSAAGLEWSLLPKFAEKVAAMASKIEAGGPASVKQVAGAIGLLMWVRYASVRSAYDLAATFSKLALAVRERGWNGAAEWSSFAHLAAKLKESLCAGPFCFTKPNTECLVFSDASTFAFGFVGGEPLLWRGGDWPEVHESKDMFVLEARAARNAIRAFKAMDRCIHIVVDNQALFFALQKGSTTCPRAAIMLQDLEELCRASRMSICPGWIRSELNPADELSRGRPFCRDKLNAAVPEVSWSSPPVRRWGSILGRVAG
jgi:hypothetical protein